MSFNPFKEKGMPLEKQIHNWAEMTPKPYDKNEVHPYTRARIILMNGTEVEGALFSHQFARHTADDELKRKLAFSRRIEQQQQKMVNSLIPGDESILEVTLGYEQVAVDLTAALAKNEPDPYVKAALDFALLEDFDHLYRYSNLMELIDGVDPARVVGTLTEIMPGRPTILEHRHPFDDVRRHYDAATADIRTKLNVATIVAGEQQTMNYYMNVGNRFEHPVARGLYAEIGMIEEQHVTHYESLADPRVGWFEMWVLHEYAEAFLYWSCAQTEIDRRVKKIWETHLLQEIEHLRVAAELMKRHEKRDPAETFGAFPEPIAFVSSKDYVREVLSAQINLTAQESEFIPTSDLPKGSRYAAYQKKVNAGGMVPSQEVIERVLKKGGQDYRQETEGPHPVGRLRDRDKAAA